jgi:hypothetical protein
VVMTSLNMATKMPPQHNYCCRAWRKNLHQQRNRSSSHSSMVAYPRRGQILLDNQSTVNIFHNKALLKDIRTTTHCMRACYSNNAGWTMVMNLISRLPGYPGEVWYNPGNGTANILSSVPPR